MRFPDVRKRKTWETKFSSHFYVNMVSIIELSFDGLKSSAKKRDGNFPKINHTANHRTLFFLEILEC